MKDRYKHLIQGAVIGAVMIAATGFFAGWVVTKGTAQTLAEKAVSGLVTKVCAQDMLTNPDSVKMLKTKRTADYDDAVRDSWKRSPVLTGIKFVDDFNFRRDCGKEIEAQMATAPKS